MDDLEEVKTKPKRAPKPKQRVAVVIPVLVCPDLLEECIKSVLAQRLPSGVEIDIVVVADGVVPPFEACRKFEGDIGAIVTQRGRGAGVAINTGIAAMRPFDVLVVICADDIITPDHIKEILSHRREGQLVGYCSRQATLGGDPEAEPTDVTPLAMAWEAAALRKLGGFMGFWCLPGEEMLARAKAGGMEVVDIPGAATYLKRTHKHNCSKMNRGERMKAFCSERAHIAKMPKTPGVFAKSNTTCEIFRTI